jgi:hypothetical protein
LTRAPAQPCLPIERGRPYLDQTLLGARVGWTHLDHLALDTQFIAETHRVRPAEFVEADAHDATCGLELALDQELHGERRRVPTARRQAAEDAVTGGILSAMKQSAEQMR